MNIIYIIKDIYSNIFILVVYRYIYDIRHFLDLSNLTKSKHIDFFLFFDVVSFSIEVIKTCGSLKKS